ncbi:MAG TPA: hypothetical protein VFF52_14610, partial [Isosphaeraceae bacterium]|nr:hypothetical protein [Isosphaeraceae bacterium]
RRGPSTQEERWEDERGFNAYTLGTLIAALLVAAEMAESQGESREWPRRSVGHPCLPGRRPARGDCAVVP